uniref:Uncharacterized protein n=1 Tax=Roseihalotalea indica TaxID=2867963 RepID=A0AA49GLG6_9BACT|nr:hypothetical protein K4G66_32235 [Tunicatimonas sp. TK19036]
MMGASGVISAMKKSYEDNRALLRRKGTFECMKDYYVTNLGERTSRSTNYEALKQWRTERIYQRRKEKWLAHAVVIGLLIITFSLWYVFNG